MKPVGRTETLACAHCGRLFEKLIGQANRQRNLVGPRVRFFCTRACSGASKRKHKTREQRVAEKAAYDREYRTRDVAALKARKHAYHQATYDPDAARTHRRAKREWHRVYAARYRACPEWKEHKQQYDRAFRARVYGAFGDCHRLLIDLEREIRRQPWYERAKERGYFDNNRTTQQRKRNEQISRW